MSISLLLFGSVLFAACLIGLITDTDQQDSKWKWTKTDTTIVIIVVSVTFVLTLILGLLMAKKKKNYIKNTPSTQPSSSEVRSPVMNSSSNDNRIFNPTPQIESEFLP